MCFSAGASFGAGAILTAIGAITIKRSSVLPPGERTALFSFAVIPLLFAVQQFSEGFVWLSHNGTIPMTWQFPSAIFFLVFAQVIWPAWVPWCMFSGETNPKRRRLLGILTLLGIALGIYHIFCLTIFPLSIKITAHHVHYTLPYTSFGRSFSSIPYILVTIFPPFISTVPKMRLVGLALLVSFLVTLFFFREHLISVWCFFAALISVLVLLVIHEKVKALKERQDIP
jgi:hypothetical protein